MTAKPCPSRHYAKLRMLLDWAVCALRRLHRLFIADILGSPTQRFRPSTQAILLRRKPMQRNSDDLATNAEKSGQLDAVERSFSRLTPLQQFLVRDRPPSVDVGQRLTGSTLLLCLGQLRQQASTPSSRVIYIEEQVLTSDCTWRRWDGSWDQPGVRAMVGWHRGPPSRPRRPVLRLGTE